MNLRRISHIFQGSMKKCLSASVSLLVIASLTVMPASAQATGFTAHVTAVLNVTNAPNSFDFETDNTPSACNGFIFFYAAGADEPSKIANFNAMYATVLAALLANHSVYIGVNNPTGGSNYCTLVWFNPGQ
jgi:hypothetical protein